MSLVERALALTPASARFSCAMHRISVFAALLAAVVLFQIGPALLGIAEEDIRWWADPGFMLMALVAALACLSAARASANADAAAWRWLAAGHFIWFAGMVVWSYRELVVGEMTPFPDLSDLLWFAVPPMLMLGMLLYRSGGADRTTILLQLTNIGAILCTLMIVIPLSLYGALNEHLHEGGTTLYGAAALAWPILYGAAFLFGIVCLGFHARGAKQMIFLLLLVSLGLHAFVSLLYARAQLDGSYQIGADIDLLWIVAFAVASWAAFEQRALASIGGHGREAILSQRLRAVENMIPGAALLTLGITVFTFRTVIDEQALALAGPILMALALLAVLRGWWALRMEGDLRQEAEQIAARLAASEELLLAFLDGSPEAITLTDIKGRYLLCNASFERLAGRSRDEILGRTSNQVVRYDDPIRTEIVGHEQRVIETRRAVRQEREESDYNGRVRSMAIIKFPVFGAKGDITGIGTISQDITDLKNAETQLRQALKMQAVGQLTGGVAHDFNNLLTVVLGNLELLHERLADEPALARLAEQAIKAGWRGATTTRRLLAFSRQQRLQPQPVDVPLLLETMSDLIRQSLGETIGFTVESAPGPWRCTADPAELETVILNLALNARDAMPDGGTLTIKLANVEVNNESSAMNDGLRPGQYVMLAVSDTGTGMTPEILERVFEPFFTTKAMDKGSGLGLSMVHGFVHQSGGHVDIETEPGAGTTVKLYLPRAAGEVSTPEECDPQSAAVTGGSERILVVEDNDLVRRHVTSQLESLGCTVVAVPDARAALAALEHDGAFDLLFSDVVMPGSMSGFDLAEAVQSSRPRLPVLLTSGYIEEGAMLGKDPKTEFKILQKPYRRHQLAKAIRAAVDRKSLPDNNAVRTD